MVAIIFLLTPPGGGDREGGDYPRTGFEEFLLTPPGGGDPQRLPGRAARPLFLLTPPGGGDRKFAGTFGPWGKFLLTPPGGGDRPCEWALHRRLEHFYSRPRAGAIEIIT